MRCIILSAENELFPRCLRPIKSRAALDYLLDDILLQKDITSISIIANSKSMGLLKKHVNNAFPNKVIKVVLKPFINNYEDDVLILEGRAHTSLKLQDFIRYFKQFKTLTKAAFDKENPKEIPFTIIPKHNQSLETHTYNCGTGYCNL